MKVQEEESVIKDTSNGKTFEILMGIIALIAIDTAHSISFFLILENMGAVTSSLLKGITNCNLQYYMAMGSLSIS